MAPWVGGMTPQEIQQRYNPPTQEDIERSKGTSTYFEGRPQGHWADITAGEFGLAGYQPAYDEYSGYFGGAQGRGGPGTTQYSQQFRAGQAGLMGMLQQQAMGQGPGQALVRLQAQQAADQAARQQFSAAQSANPSQGALAFRQAGLNAAQAQSAVGGQAAQAGLQAQLGAIGQLGQVTAQGRQADEAMNMYNTDVIMRQRALNDQYQLGMGQQRLGLQELGQRGQLAYQDARTQRYLARAQRNAQQSANKWGALGQAFGVGAQVLPGLGGGGGQSEYYSSTPGTYQNGRRLY